MNLYIDPGTGSKNSARKKTEVAVKATSLLILELSS